LGFVAFCGVAACRCSAIVAGLVAVIFVVAVVVWCGIGSVLLSFCRA